jgi:hypothetical protein
VHNMEATSHIYIYLEECIGTQIYIKIIQLHRRFFYRSIMQVIGMPEEKKI